MSPTATAPPLPADSPSVDAYTKGCQDVAGSNANPRAKFLADSFMKHLHAWAREVDLTLEEWLHGCNSMARAGQMSDERRNEFILISDVLGLESLLDTMTHEREEKRAAQQGSKLGQKATDSAILGPFFREGAPKYEMGADIVLDHEIVSQDGKKGETTTMWGKVTGQDGKAVKGAVIDVWHTGPNGLYEQQDPKQPDYNYRGQFTTGSDGSYSFKCLRPTAYPIPYDGPAGDILKALDRSPMRPAHIHLLIKAPGFQTLITQIYDKGCEYVERDSVFATKDSLVVDFGPPKSKGVTTQHELEYDIVLVPDV